MRRTVVQPGETPIRVPSPSDNPCIVHPDERRMNATFIFARKICCLSITYVCSSYVLLFFLFIFPVFFTWEYFPEGILYLPGVRILPGGGGGCYDRSLGGCVSNPPKP